MIESSELAPSADVEAAVVDEVDFVAAEGMVEGYVAEGMVEGYVADALSEFDQDCEAYSDGSGVGFQCA